MLRKKGGLWCQETNCIRDPNDRPVVNVHFWDHFNLRLLSDTKKLGYLAYHLFQSSYLKAPAQKFAI